MPDPGSLRRYRRNQGVKTPPLPPDVDEIKSEIKRILKRFFYKMLERRPVIIPEIITL